MPIDVGAPTYTSRAGSPPTLTGTNFSTAMRLYLWDDNFGGVGEEDGSIFFASPTGIHGQTSLGLQSPSIDTAHGYSNLHILNPIGYSNKFVSQVLLDFLTEQLHVGHGVVRMSPVADGPTSDWGAFGAKYAQIDEPMTDPNALSNSMTTSVANKEQDLLFPSLPSNVLRPVEAIVAFFGSMTKGPSGSDEGLGFGFQLQHPSLGNLSRKLIADMYANGTIDAKRVKLDRLAHNLPGIFNAGWLAVTSERGAAGASPNPNWKVYALEMLVYYEGSEPSYDIIDMGAHSALDSYFTTHPLVNPAGGGGPWNLDFDVIDTTGYSALLDILAHAPEIFYYIDYRGQLVPKKVGAYADVATPRGLSTVDGSIIAVRRGPYRIDERYANAIELRWGVAIPHQASGTATADPVNEVIDRGARKVLIGAQGVPVASWEDRKAMDRHFIEGRGATPNKAVAEACAKIYLNMWGEENGREVMGLDLVCPYSCIDVEPGDVVALTIPSLGLAAQNYLCVEKTFDLDRNELNITVYDVEMTLTP